MRMCVWVTEVACTIGEAIFDAGNQSRFCANSSCASRPTKNGGAA